jgi:hypothetical protein
VSSQIYWITRFLEEKRTGFAVARLIMLCGVHVRGYEADSVDQPDELQRVQQAVETLLDEPERIALAKLLKAMH